jgi:hypothetical protein
MNAHWFVRGVTVCALVLGLSGCVVYDHPPEYGYQPAPPPYYGEGYYGPGPGYAYAPPPVYAAPSLSLGFGFWGGGHGGGHHR